MLGEARKLSRSVLLSAEAAASKIVTATHGRRQVQTMTEGKAERYARSARNVGILLTIWGAFAIAFGLLIETPDYREGRLPHVLGVWRGGITLIIIGLGTATAMHLALARSQRSCRVVRFAAVSTIVYAVVWTVVFVATTMVGVRLVSGVGGTVAALAMLIIACLVILKGKHLLESVARLSVRQAGKSRRSTFRIRSMVQTRRPCQGRSAVDLRTDRELNRFWLVPGQFKLHWPKLRRRLMPIAFS